MAKEDTGPRPGRRGSVWFSGAALSVWVFAACGGARHDGQDAGVLTDAGSVDGPQGTEPRGWDADLIEVPGDSQLAPDGPTPSYPDFVTSLPSVDAFFAMLGEYGEIKVLGQVDGAVPPAPELAAPCIFQNTLRFPGHAPFLRNFPGLAGMSFDAYLGMVMKRSGRVLWGGALQFFPAVSHPLTGAPGILGYFLYSDSNEEDALTDDEIVALDARMKACVPFARDLLVLVGMDQDQAALFDAQRERLKTRGVSVLPAGQLRQGFAGEGYSLAQSFGTLNLDPAGGPARNHGPHDVVVAETAPSEISPLAGLVTASTQDPQGPLNLSLRQGAIPNGHVPGIYGNRVLPLFDGRPVHIVVGASQIQINPAPRSAVEEFWKDRDP